MTREQAAEIEVYCDDPRHARGKVAEVGTLLVLGGGDRARWSFIGSRHGSPRGMTTLRPGTSDASSVFWCPLCPRRPSLTDARIQELCDGLSKLGITRVSLALLDA